MPTPQTVNTETKTIPAEKINEALLFIQDYLERSAMDYFVLGEVGKQLKETIEVIEGGERVEIGILRKDYSESGSSMMHTLLLNSDYVSDMNYITVDDVVRRISFTYKNDVPIVLKVIDGEWSFFKNPDTVFYRLTEFPLPNPFDEYWKNRKEIK